MYHRIVDLELFLSGELRRVWNDAVITELDVLSRNLFRETEETHEQRQDDRPPARRLNSRPVDKGVFYVLDLNFRCIYFYTPCPSSLDPKSILQVKRNGN
jgi:hypothetical protein